MSTRIVGYENLVPLICRLPIGTYYSAERDGSLETQAKNQREMKSIRSCFPGTIWEKKYDKTLNWWECQGEFDGTKIRIYGCGESPEKCKIITEKKMVKERVPIGYEEKWVEKDVIIGYDCGGGDTDIESRKHPEENETRDTIVVESPTEHHQATAGCGMVAAGVVAYDALERGCAGVAHRPIVPHFIMDKPRIICLCGSSRFVAEMAVIAWTLEKEGNIVLGLHLLPESYGPPTDHLAEHEGVAEKMDELHLRKIDLADLLMIVNIGGYIGDSTRNEIKYATACGKLITYLEE